MLTPEQLVTVARLRLGLERVADAVDRLNVLGREVGMPPLAIRCCGSAMLSGHIAADSYLLDIEIAHLAERVGLMIEPEMLAA